MKPGGWAPILPIGPATLRGPMSDDHKSSERRSSVFALAPGVTLAAAVAIAATLLGRVLPSVVGTTVVAILLGLAVGSTVRMPATQPGLRFAVTWLLRIGIVLLGAELSVAAVLDVGLSMLALVIGLVASVLALAWLGARALGIEPRLGLLLGVGTAICGNTAIIATAPIIGAREREVGFAVATITLCGLVAVLAYPAIGHALGMTDADFGRWSGVAVNDTSQVVATSFAYSDPAAEVAIVVKLMRNTLMAPVLLGIGAWYAAGRAGDGPARGGLRQAVPWFVLGFIGMAALSSLGLLDATIGETSLREIASISARSLILVALAALGLSTRVAELRRVGLRPLLFGASLAAVLAIASLLLIRLTAP